MDVKSKKKIERGSVFSSSETSDCKGGSPGVKGVFKDGRLLSIPP